MMDKAQAKILVDDYISLVSACDNFVYEYQSRPKIARAIIKRALGYLGNHDLNRVVDATLAIKERDERWMKERN